jgi:pimeloyl-ACP methyl ester carboxylesterase
MRAGFVYGWATAFFWTGRMTIVFGNKTIQALLFCATLTHTASASDPIAVQITSTVDQSEQFVYVLSAQADGPRPLLVVLHNWSANVAQFDGEDWEAAARAVDWHLVFPDFRGANNRPAACASRVARQDVLDAVDYVVEHYAVDETRIYLAGTSGGGHMSMVMAAHAPERWTAVSAWAGISDLSKWHAETKAAGHKYWQDIEHVVGGAPGGSDEIDAELRFRSPVHHLAKAKDLPVEIATGIHDGHEGSVPIHHSIDAFNVIAEALGEDVVDQKTIDDLSRADYDKPPAFFDESYGRGIHLRKHAGKARITIFEGGHEGLPAAAVAWLSQYSSADGGF